MPRRKQNGATSISEEAKAWFNTGEIVGRLRGHVESDCEGLGSRIGLHGREVSVWLGTLLLGKEIWPLLGNSDSLQNMRLQAGPDSVKQRKVEGHASAHIQKSKTHHGLKKVSGKLGRPPKKQVSDSGKGGRSYWSKLTPEQRTVEMVKRRAVAKKNAGKEGGGTTKPGNNSWGKFDTPEKRSAEIKRRHKVTLDKKAAQVVPAESSLFESLG